MCVILLIWDVKICAEKLANPIKESHKNISFFEFTHVRPAGRPPDSTIANSRFFCIFNDVDFGVVTGTKSINFNIRYACSFGAPSLPRAFTALFIVVPVVVD